MALRIRRGTDAERQTITPLQGEPVYATDTGKLYIGDGATQGGVLVGPVDATDFDLVNDVTPQLGGDLDLNGNNITGTGNINIDGTITATGNIGLGDADSDTITVSGVINSNLRPALDTSYDLGSMSRSWANVWADRVHVGTDLVVGQSIIKMGPGGAPDSSYILYDADLDVVTATSINAQSFDGDLRGSVTTEDGSTKLVDASSGLVLADVENTSVTTNLLALNGPLSGIDIKTEGTQDDDYSLFTIQSFHDSSSSSAQIFVHGRGSIASPAAIQAGDTIIDSLYAGISSNGAPGPAVQINTSADPDGTVSNNVVPGLFSVSTFNDSGAPVTGLSLNRNGELGVADNTLVAGAGSGEVDDSAVVEYLQITVGSTTYAMPLYAINP